MKFLIGLWRDVKANVRDLFRRHCMDIVLSTIYEGETEEEIMLITVYILGLNCGGTMVPLLKNKNETERSIFE